MLNPKLSLILNLEDARRRVSRYQRGNQNSLVEERRKTHWQKKDKRTKNDLQNTTQKTKDRAKRTTPKIGGDIVCSERKSSSCSTSNTRRLTLVKIPVISLQ
jgi:type II secretory pathway pseudopilin PulG